MSQRPILHLIGGPNGAGKSAFAVDYLPAVGSPPFFNADVLAAKLSPSAPDAALLQAGRLLLSRMSHAIAAKKTFALETTLSGRGYRRLIRRAHEAGYEVRLTFIWIETVDQSIERVAARVEQGGHDVPEPVLRRRHATALKNFFHVYLPLVDHWFLLDNSQGRFQQVAIGSHRADLPDQYAELFSRSTREASN